MAFIFISIICEQFDYKLLIRVFADNKFGYYCIKFIIIFKLKIIMSQDKIENQDDGKGVCRRSRKDDQGRDYVCGCGKKYLSYPALYTHIKTKHEGNQPQGTQKTGTINKRQKQKIDQKLVKEITGWVQLQNLHILNELDNSTGTVLISQRMRRDLIGRELFEAYNNLLRVNTLSLNKSSPLQLVLIVYLIGAGRFVSESLYNYYAMFAKLFRNCYHQHLQQITEACFKQQFGEKITKVSTQECKLAPIICDFFIRFYIPVEIKQSSEDLKYFCRWMYENKLSIIEVTLKTEYKMTRKNFIQPKKKEKKQSVGRHKKNSGDIHCKEDENQAQNEGDQLMDAEDIENSHSNNEKLIEQAGRNEQHGAQQREKKGNAKQELQENHQNYQIMIQKKKQMSQKCEKGRQENENQNFNKQFAEKVVVSANQMEKQSEFNPEKEKNTAKLISNMEHQQIKQPENPSSYLNQQFQGSERIKVTEKEQNLQCNMEIQACPQSQNKE